MRNSPIAIALVLALAGCTQGSPAPVEGAGGATAAEAARAPEPAGDLLDHDYRPLAGEGPVVVVQQISRGLGRPGRFGRRRASGPFHGSRGSLRAAGQSQHQRDCDRRVPHVRPPCRVRPGLCHQFG